MGAKVTIVDYGMGNIFSVARAIEAVGGEPFLASKFADVRDAERLLLPGVGAFEPCARNLEHAGLADATRAFVETGRPFLGICVGMQLLFDYSLEFGKHEGLGLIPGHVAPILAIDENGQRKVPHIGWSRVSRPEGGMAWDDTALADCESGENSFYFVHSYNCEPTDPSVVLAEADYLGSRICAAVKRDNITAFQCHPEKSSSAGLSVFRRFLSE